MDTSYRAEVLTPNFTDTHPVVCFDEGHYNTHTAGGRYRPIADLLQADGYVVRRPRDDFSAEGIEPCQVLVIANAAGGDRWRLGRINLPIKIGGERNDPAFTQAEVELVHRWVQSGGNLLLVADHAPFGEAAQGLAAAFGVRMHGGSVELPSSNPASRGPGRAMFSVGDGSIRPHPITRDLQRLMTFTGQSLTGAGEPLLRLPRDAIEFVPPGPVLKGVPAGGHAQAVALASGRGRVVVLGEAGMITAQIDQAGEKMGMQVEGTDNEAFARAIFHWLARGR